MGAREFDVAGVVNKLVGPIEPVGETETDENRLENLKHMIDVVDDLIYKIENTARHATRHERSMKVAGAIAQSFIDGLRQRGS